MRPADNAASPSFADRENFENASRGFIDSLKPCIIRDRDGRVVWDNDQYSFVNDDCPETVNPSLWRQAQLCYKQGLFIVTKGIYQVRGLDLSNMTIVEGRRGVVVIDPLISAECAAAALELYRQHRGNRPVTGAIWRPDDEPQIAERIRLPASLQRASQIQGYYGSVSHNVKAVYQRYMSWFDGNPAHLWQHPPEQEGKRYVDNVVRRAQEYSEIGDLRFAATLVDHARFAVPTPQVKVALASVFERLGHGAENATWRNFYLTRAQDLREPARESSGQMPGFRAVSPLLSVDEWLDGLSIQIDGNLADGEALTLEMLVEDEKRRWRVTVSNGALIYRSQPEQEHFRGPAGLSLRLSKAQLAEVLQGDIQAATQAEGDLSVLSKLLALLSIPVKSRSRI